MDLIIIPPDEEQVCIPLPKGTIVDIRGRVVLLVFEHLLPHQRAEAFSTVTEGFKEFFIGYAADKNAAWVRLLTKQYDFQVKVEK